LRDFALVPAAAVAFSPGLVAISGQSGAGKSVLLDALGQLLGAAAAQDCVRPPADVAVVEGAWWCGPEAAAAAGVLLRGLGLPARALPGAGGQGGSSSGGVIHIRREVRLDGHRNDSKQQCHQQPPVKLCALVSRVDKQQRVHHSAMHWGTAAHPSLHSACAHIALPCVYIELKSRPHNACCPFVRSCRSRACQQQQARLPPAAAC
jgi:energy-coupling factor transporter ATP-binding protein EcfA2